MKTRPQPLPLKVSSKPSSGSRAGRVLSRQIRELSLLASVGQALTSTHDLIELLDTLSRALLESVGCTVSKIHWIDAKSRTVSIRAARARRQIDWNTPGGGATPIECLPIHNWIVVTGQPLVLTRENAKTQLLESEYSILFSPQLQSILLVPLLVKCDCLGVAVLGEMRKWERSPFSQQRIDLAQTFGHMAALAIQNLKILETLASRTEQLRILYRNVADGIILVDRRGRIRFANPAAERLLGYTSDQMAGQECPKVVQLSSAAEAPGCGLACPVRDVAGFHWDTPLVEFKESIVRGDGTIIQINHRMAPIRREDGQIEGVVSLIRDISHEEQVLRLKSEFVSMIIHELRAPLADIQASASLLAQKELAPKIRQDMAQIMNQECMRLSGMVNNVLESSRIENGQFDLSIEPIAVVPLIGQVVHSFQARNQEYKLEVSSPECPLFALGDPAWVQVILENLIQNAIDYSGSEPTVTISAQEFDGVVKISVKDQGDGIPADQIDNVFDKFHRLGASRRKVRGFGLGLYISKMLVEVLGGTIGVKSEVGRGSIFYFTLKACNDGSQQDPRD